MGSEEFVKEVLKSVHDRDLMQNIPRKQLLADRPGLEELFISKVQVSKKRRNRQVKAAFEEHQYTLKEIGNFLNLHPDYLSRLLSQMRKR